MMSFRRSLACFVFAASFAILPVSAEIEKAQAEVADQNRFLADSADLLYRGEFKELDRMAKELREKSIRWRGGVWKLRHFSDAISHPKNQEDAEDWKFLFAKLDEWNKASATPFAKMILGKAYLNYGWNARGHDFAHEVDDKQWPNFAERLRQAETTLLAALEEDPKSPELYRNLLHVGISRSWPRERMEKTLREAIAVAPDYYDDYYNMAFFLMERWYGKRGDWQKFANSIPNLVEGEEGYIIYTRVAMQLWPWYQKDFFAEDKPEKISWLKMKRGFEAMMKKYPDSGWDLNRYAYFAWLARDRPTGAPLMKALDEKQLAYDAAWNGQESLDAARKWFAEEEGK